MAEQQLFAVDAEMVLRASNAIKECMANDAWKLHGVRPGMAEIYVRRAAELALTWAANPDRAFVSGESAAATTKRHARSCHGTTGEMK